MKKLLLLSAMAVFGLSNVNAQEEKVEKTFGFEKGNIIVEGNLGFSSNKDNNEPVTTNSTFSFNPKVGYFVTEKLVAGIQLNLNTSKQEIDLEDNTVLFDTENKTNNFGAGVFARYYFLELGERFKTYGEFGAGFGNTKNETQSVATGDTTDFESKGIRAGVSLGINYFVTECFAINFGLSDILAYRSDKVDADGAESVNSFSGNLNLFNNFFQTAQFGLTYKF